MVFAISTFNNWIAYFCPIDYMINSIPTIYKGIKFRSKLEAQWAVFFDEIKIKYEYEPTKFALTPTLRYIPDFYFPDFDYYIEIKPRIQKDISSNIEAIKSHSDFIKWDLLSRMGKNIIVLFGPPHPNRFFLINNGDFIKMEFYFNEYGLWRIVESSSGINEDGEDLCAGLSLMMEHMGKSWFYKF